MNRIKVYPKQSKSNRTLVYLAIIFVMLNVIDAILTLVLGARGGYELNWIAQYALENSLWAFWLIKVGATLAFVSLFLLFAETFPRLARWIFIISVIAMLGVCIFNAIGLTVV